MNKQRVYAAIALDLYMDGKKTSHAVVDAIIRAVKEQEENDTFEEDEEEEELLEANELTILRLQLTESYKMIDQLRQILV